MRSSFEFAFVKRGFGFSPTTAGVGRFKAPTPSIKDRMQGGLSFIDFPIAFQYEYDILAFHEQQTGCLAGDFGLDGFENVGTNWLVAWVWDCPEN